MENGIRSIAPRATFPTERVARREGRREEGQSDGRGFEDELASESEAELVARPEANEQRAPESKPTRAADDEPGAHLDVTA